MNIERSPYDIPLVSLYEGAGYQQYELTEDVTIDIPEVKLSNGETVKAATITVPEGFQTDGRSSGILSGFFNPWLKGGLAWLAHDFFYVMDYGIELFGWTIKVAREYADKAMYAILKALNSVKNIKNALSFYAVRVFGRKVYVQSRDVEDKCKMLNLN